MLIKSSGADTVQGRQSEDNPNAILEFKLVATLEKMLEKHQDSFRFAGDEPAN